MYSNFLRNLGTSMVNPLSVSYLQGRVMAGSHKQSVGDELICEMGLSNRVLRYLDVEYLHKNKNIVSCDIS